MICRAEQAVNEKLTRGVTTAVAIREIPLAGSFAFALLLTDVAFKVYMKRKGWCE